MVPLEHGSRLPKFRSSLKYDVITMIDTTSISTNKELMIELLAPQGRAIQDSEAVQEAISRYMIYVCIYIYIIDLERDVCMRIFYIYTNPRGEKIETKGCCFRGVYAFQPSTGSGTEAAALVDVGRAEAQKSHQGLRQLSSRT